MNLSPAVRHGPVCMLDIGRTFALADMGENEAWKDFYETMIEVSLAFGRLLDGGICDPCVGTGVPAESSQ